MTGPWQVPDDPIAEGIDTDGDGEVDTIVVLDGDDLVVATDLDGDGVADRILGIGRDGLVRDVLRESPGAGVYDAAVLGIDFGWGGSGSVGPV